MLIHDKVQMSVVALLGPDSMIFFPCLNMLKVIINHLQLFQGGIKYETNQCTEGKLNIDFN